MKYRPHEQRGKLAKSDQVEVLWRALKLVRDFSVAVDGGAHKGKWAAALAERFTVVHAFESAADMAEILRRVTRPPVTVHEAALWRESDRLQVIDRRPNKSRSRFVGKIGPSKYPVLNWVDAVALDSLALQTCGLIKLDLEGAEMPALIGATETLERCRPVVIVECWDLCYRNGFGYQTDDPGKFLGKLGAREAFRLGGDRVYAWS